jgi:hypothetical protein
MSQEIMIAQLSSSVSEVARASTPATMFKVLLETSRVAAPRAAIFLVRKGEVHGWGSLGYSTEIAGRQREYRQPLKDSWLQTVCDDRSGEAIEDSGNSLEFGQESTASRVACALRIRDRAIAIVVLERGEEETPWQPAALALMLNVGRLRLELEVATRRAANQESTQPVPATEVAAESDQPATDSPPAKTEAAPSPTESPAAEASPELAAARRYAKLVATDIRLYNEEAVMLGRKNGDLIDRLGEHIERGKETFMQRHPSLGPAGSGVLLEALVAVLAAGDDSLIPPTLLD